MDKKIDQTIFLLIGIIVLVWFVTISAPAKLLDDRVNDQFSRWQQRPQESQILWVITDNEQSTKAKLSPGTLPTLLNQMTAQGARHVVLTQALSANDYSALNDPGMVTINPLNLDFSSQEQSPASHIMPIPPTVDGSHRHHWLWYPSHQGKTKSITASVASKLGLAMPDAQLLRLNLYTQAIPQIRIEQLNNNLGLGQLVKDKLVILGEDDVARGLYLPVLDQRVSLVHFEALALDTILSGNIKLEFNSTEKLLLVTLCVLICFVLLRLLRERDRNLFYGLSLPLVITASYMLYHFGNILFPLSAILLSLSACHLLCKSQSRRTRAQHIFDTIRAVKPLTRNRKGLERLYHSERYWESIHDFLRQSVNAQQAVLFKASPHQHLLSIAASYRCDKSNLRATSFDARQTPFSDALNQDNAVALAADFFTAQNVSTSLPHGHGYLLPLVHQNSLQGFWAFVLDHERSPQEISTELDHATEFAQQAARLCYFRQQWQNQQKRQTHWLQRIFNRHSYAQGISDYAQTIEDLSRHLRLNDEVIHHQSTGMVIYDPFGQVLHANTAARQILNEHKIAVFETTIQHTLQQLTQVEPQDTQRIFNSLMLSKEAYQCQVNSAAEGVKLQLRLSTLSTDQTLAGEAHPFSTMAILFEIITIDNREQQDLREQLLAHVAEVLNEKLQSSIAANDGQFAVFVERKQYLEGIRKFSTKVTNLLSNEQTALEHNGYPINIQRVLADTCLAKQARIDQLGIQINQQIERHQVFAFAGLAELAQLFSVVLDTLIEDCNQENSIHIQVSRAKDGEIISCSFSSNGLGMPQSRIDEYLFGREQPRLKLFGELRQAVNKASSWAERIKIESSIGTGIKFTIHLYAFI